MNQQHTRKIQFQTLAVISGVMLVGSVQSADWKFTAGVSASETYTDNVGLSTNVGAFNQTGTRNSDFITSIRPSFSAKKDGARLKVDAQYAINNLLYARESERNSLYHQLNAKANAELLQKEIFLDAAASVSQAAISPLNATGGDVSSSTNNVANVRTFTLSPYWTHRFGSTANLNARYTVSSVSNDTAGFASSTTNSYVLGLNSGSDFGRVSWGLNFSEQDANYQDRSDVKFTSTSASLGYLLSSHWRVVGTVGNEHNQFATTTGNAPGGTFWNATVSWAPSSRTSIDAGVGHRFYGNSYNFAFRTRGAHSTWTASYDESLNTSNNQFTQSGLGFNSAQPSSSSLFLFNQNVLTNQVFLTKRFSTAFSWTKGKHDFRVDAFHSTQTTRIDGTTNTVTVTLSQNPTLNTSNDIFLQTNNVKQVGLSGSWGFKISPTISSNMALGVTRFSYADLNRTDTTSSLRVGLDRRFSPKLNGSVSYRHQNRTSDQSGGDFSENAVTGSINYQF